MRRAIPVAAQKWLIPAFLTLFVLAQDADLGLNVVLTPDPVILAGEATYQIQVHNNGPDTATAVTVTHQLPVGADLVNAEPPCTFDSQTRICQWDLGDIVADGTLDLVLTVNANFAPDGGGIDIFFNATDSSNSTPTVFRLLTPGAGIGVVAPLPNNPNLRGIDFLPDGAVVVVDSGSFDPLDGQSQPLLDGSLVRLDVEPQVVTDGTFLINPSGLAVSPAGMIYVTDPEGVEGPNSGRVIAVVSADGQQTVLASGDQLAKPSDVVLTDSGALAVLEYTGKVVLVDPDDGMQTLLSEAGFFLEPVGIAQEASGDFVVADVLGGIIRVDGQSGAQSQISTLEKLRMPAAPDSIAVGFDGRLYVSDSSGFILRLDEGTGSVLDSFSGMDLGFSNPTGLTLVHFYNSDTQVTATSVDNNAGNDQIVFSAQVIKPSSEIILSVNEGVTVGETVSLALAALVDVGESITVTDDAAVVPAPQIAVQESVNLVDTAAAQLAPQSDSDENIGVSEVVTVQAVSDPPGVAAVLTQSGRLNLTEQPEVLPSITGLHVLFTKIVADPPGDDGENDVTNPQNFLLVKGDQGAEPQTQSCVDGAASQDIVVPLAGVTFLANVPAAVLHLTQNTALDAGRYRLLACGTTSIVDDGNQPLDGNGDGIGGDDFLLNFQVLNSNRLVNPNLDEDLEGWTASQWLFAQDDSDGLPTSGSALADLEPNSPRSLVQCLTIDPTRWYNLSGRVRYNGSAPNQLTLVAQVTWYEALNCEGEILSTWTVPITTADTGLGWIHFNAVQQPPEGCQSAEVAFIASSQAGGPQQVFWDNLRFAEDLALILGDGFETGDLSLWTP